MATSKIGVPGLWHPKNPYYKLTLVNYIMFEHGNKLHPQGFLKHSGSQRLAFKNVNSEMIRVN